MLRGLLLAVPDWARLSIRASVLPVVRHSRRTVLMPKRQHSVRLAAAEGSLQTDNGIAALAGKPLNRTMQHLP